MSSWVTIRAEHAGKLSVPWYSVGERGHVSAALAVGKVRERDPGARRVHLGRLDGLAVVRDR